MSSVFRAVTSIFKAPKPPKPDPRIAQAQARQEAILAKQEARTLEREKSEKRKLSARKKARRSGGMRLLLSSDRANAMTGIEDELKTTLGG
tara:strand:- start:1851 stop:2123 length:273 start_codon:yes stop_codon:yes gene_type:complete